MFDPLRGILTLVYRREGNRLIIAVLLRARTTRGLRATVRRSARHPLLCARHLWKKRRHVAPFAAAQTGTTDLDLSVTHFLSRQKLTYYMVSCSRQRSTLVLCQPCEPCFHIAGNQQRFRGSAGASKWNGTKVLDLLCLTIPANTSQIAASIITSVWPIKPSAYQKKVIVPCHHDRVRSNDLN